MSENDEQDRLPWSREAEQSVLGGLLLDNDALARITSLVTAGSFWHAPHRAIFAAIERLVLAGQPADAVTVNEVLRDAGKDEECGGTVYLHALSQSVPSAANIRRYAEIVADKALRRAILAAADAVPKLVHEAGSADAALDRVQTLLASVKRVKAGRDPKRLGELITARIDHWEAIERGEIAPGLPTGLAVLDEVLGGGLNPGQVVVLAARPSVGKTSLATQILLHVGGQGQPCLMLSQEMAAGIVVDRTAARLGQIHLQRIRTGRMEADDWTQVVDVADRAAAMPVFIDDQPALSLLDIRAKVRQVQRQAGGLALVVVDHLQLCSGPGGAEKRHHQIEQISRGIKVLAKELSVCVLLLAQLNRASEEGEPEMYHLKESGSIEEDADAVVLLSPFGKEPDGTSLILAKVAKNRDGRRVRIALSFRGDTQTWVPSSSSVVRHATA